MSELGLTETIKTKDVLLLLGVEQWSLLPCVVSLLTLCTMLIATICCLQPQPEMKIQKEIHEDSTYPEMGILKKNQVGDSTHPEMKIQEGELLLAPKIQEVRIF